MKKLNLPKDEMAFRMVYKDLLLNEKINTVFRPHKRICGDFRGYCDEQIVNARIIKNVGADWAGIAPEFLPSKSKKIKITKITSKKLKSFTKNDFLRSSPDVHDKTSLKYHLGLIYNISLKIFRPESIITKIEFEYL